MKILGIDTTTDFLYLGISDGVKVYEYSLNLSRRNAALLIPTIERVLRALGWTVNDIDYFACGLGPGSFTGIRVGLATIKGLGWSLAKPLIGIPSLDMLAKNVKENNTNITVALDAKRGLIYYANYKIKNNRLKRISGYMLLSKEEFLKKLTRGSFILGDAVGLYREDILRQKKAVVLLDKDYWRMRPGNIIALAQEKIKEKKLDDAFSIKPIYLYAKECQIRTHK